MRVCFGVFCEVDSSSSLKALQALKMKQEAVYLRTGNNEFELLLLFNPIIPRLFEVGVGGGFRAS